MIETVIFTLLSSFVASFGLLMFWIDCRLSQQVDSRCGKAPTIWLCLMYILELQYVKVEC